MTALKKPPWALLVVPVFLLLLPFATSASAATHSVGGFAEAYGLLVDANLRDAGSGANVPVNIAPLAPAASSCSPNTPAKTAQVLGPVGDPAVAQADLLRSVAGTDCIKKETLASAQTTNFAALGADAQPAIQADLIVARSATSCAGAPKGSTVFTNLTVGGTPVPLPTEVEPNFDLLPELFGPMGLRVILNEQHPAASGRGLVVNGMHIIGAPTGSMPIIGSVVRGDVVVSHAVSGIVCPGGPGSDNGGLAAPDISLAMNAAPLTAEAGESVTYTATVKNTSTTPCVVRKLIGHIVPAFDFVSTAGPLGTAPDTPAPVRTDGGVDVVLRPTSLTVAPGATATQTFTVKVKGNVVPGTYYNSLELYCGLGGNFVSGPLAAVDVTVTGTLGIAAAATATASMGGNSLRSELPSTGGAPVAAFGAVLLLSAAVAVRRLRRT